MCISFWICSECASWRLGQTHPSRKWVAQRRHPAGNSVPRFRPFRVLSFGRPYDIHEANFASGLRSGEHPLTRGGDVNRAMENRRLVSDDVLWLGHAIIAIYRDFKPKYHLPPEHTSGSRPRATVIWTRTSPAAPAFDVHDVHHVHRSLFAHPVALCPPCALQYPPEAGSRSYTVRNLSLQPLTPEFIRSLRGSLKGEPSALKALLSDPQTRA